MTLCDYFSAVDDRAAVAVVESVGGPAAAGLDTVAFKNLDPVIHMAALEAVMTGCGYEEAGGLPRSGELLSSPEHESAFVISLSDTLFEALATAIPGDLARAAELWCGTEEVRHPSFDAATATGVLDALCGLARRARAADHRLYCWWAL